jgi:hypothetical protein
MRQYDYISFMDGLIGDPDEEVEEKIVLSDIGNGRNVQRGSTSPSKANGLH